MTLILFICLAKKVNLIPPNFGDLQFEGSLKMVPADGVLFHANSLKIDEQEITGPHDIVQKDLQIDPFVLSDSKLIEGIGTMLRLINNNKTVKKILDRKVQKSDY
ncbi:P-type ATPase A domain superfamily [Arabidopsis thaliana x Arabidopsis arenosa]|uniref:P-type ATPase A domain superfamily n=1 Tax=Arabidopsis thaliana x Arabidopsis arenosa TaxID=1240361 RepID=A0A8T2AWN7_9BRAS|nr:P-type ATPase A domain superfamily [Arabidopsis thaliana x Arabidopsis arenosa]